ncbi:MAG: diguanylate cyclase [Faecalibacterium sp.]|jgi:diguanylate cyclase (GGDEF)-like protein|nr:diguanylate cyclase [Faecalibacterium sp.]
MKATEIALYLEVNTLFVFILAVLARSVREASSSTLSDRLLMNFLSLLAVILACDCFTCISDGHIFPGSFFIGVASNTVGFALSAVVSLLWAIYVDCKVGHDTNGLQRRIVWLSIPAAVQVLLALVSQTYHIFFYIDEACRYRRGGWFWLQAVIQVFYLLYAAAVAHRQAQKERLQARRDECHMLALFGLFPVLGGILQAAFYGFPALWPMTVCAMLMVVLNLQKSQIATDALTGLNNRGRFDQYLAAQAKEFDPYETLYMILLDVDNFKEVNDTYGHTAGDAALVHVADCLKRAAARDGDFVARYGGDEFAMVCRCRSDEEVESIERRIYAEMQNYNLSAAKTEPKLTVSMGFAALPRGGAEDAVDCLIAQADEKMYEAKRLRHAIRQWDGTE